MIGAGSARDRPQGNDRMDGIDREVIARDAPARLYDEAGPQCYVTDDNAVKVIFHVHAGRRS